MTAKRVRCAGTVVGYNDPKLFNKKNFDQQIKGTLGITG